MLKLLIQKLYQRGLLNWLVAKQMLMPKRQDEKGEFSTYTNNIYRKTYTVYI